jgi:arylsulfatase A-like enzyme
MPLQKPNILFVVQDTLRRDRLSTYGNSRETSPELDAFAAEATLFERAISAAQWTVPSHASMFTGLYPSTHGLTQADGMLSGAYPALAEILRLDGYHTVAFCNNPLVGVLNNGLQRGFTRFYNYASAAPFRPVEARRGKLQRQLLRNFRRYMARPIGNQFAHSDFLFRMSLNPLFVPLWTRLINYKGNTVHSIDDLMTYWEQHQAGGTDEPIFAFLNLMGTHTPYNPPQDYLDRVAPEMRHNRQAYSFMRRFNSEAARWASPADPPLQDWEHDALNHFYEAEIAHQDYHLGRLLRRMREIGALDNTLVIICADHGEGHGDHEFVGHGFVVYQELVHVPLIIRYPERFPAGKRITTTVSTRRLFHTVLETVGLQPPLDVADPNADIAALTLHNVANGQDDAEHGIVFAEAFPPLTFLNVIQHRAPALIERMGLHSVRRGIYEGQHKLAVLDQQVEGLFDVDADPTEVRNIAGDLSAKVSEMQRKLSGLVALAESRRAEEAFTAEVDESVIDHLRALGYIE